MTFARYGHLKFKAVPLVTVILVSWGIALVEYWFAVPANRMGSAVYSPAELTTIQEVITLAVFAGFTAAYSNQPLSLTQGTGFALIALGALLVLGRRRLDPSEQIADRQDDIGDNGNPEAVLGDEWDRRKFANHGQRGHNQRHDEDDCCRWCQIHLQPLPLY
jgi:uncharacterized protein (DUF486 family)